MSVRLSDFNIRPKRNSIQISHSPDDNICYIISFFGTNVNKWEITRMLKKNKADALGQTCFIGKYITIYREDDILVPECDITRRCEHHSG